MPESYGSLDVARRKAPRVETVAVNRRRPVVAQADLAATTLTDLYTAPAGWWVTGTVRVANRTAGALTIRVALAPLGAGDTLAHYIAYGTSVAANSTWESPVLYLAATDVVRVYASAVDMTAQFNGTKDAL